MIRMKQKRQQGAAEDLELDETSTRPQNLSPGVKRLPVHHTMPCYI